MNINLSLVLFFALFIVLVSPFALIGDWKLINIDGQATDK